MILAWASPFNDSFNKLAGKIYNVIHFKVYLV